MKYRCIKPHTNSRDEENFTQGQVYILMGQDPVNYIQGNQKVVFKFLDYAFKEHFQSLEEFRNIQINQILNHE